MRSVRSCIKKLRVFGILLVTFVFLLVGLIVINVESFDTTYLRVRNYFNTVNDVIAGRKDYKELLEIMKETGFDVTEYQNLIGRHAAGEIGREDLIQQVRSFAQHLREYEYRSLRNHSRRARAFYTLLISGSFVFVALLLGTTRSLKRFVENTMAKIKNIAENVYISSIEVGETIFEEDRTINEAISEVNLVHSIYELLRHTPLNTSVEEFIFTLGPYLCTLFNSHRFSVALIDWDSETVIAEAAYFSLPDAKPRLTAGFSQSLSRTSLGIMIRENQSYRIINNLKERYEQTKSVSTKLILDEGFNSSLTVLATVNTKPFGFFFLSAVETDNYTERDAKLFLSVSEMLSQRLLYSLTTQRLLSYFGNSLVSLVEFKDNETGNHVKRVALYAKTIAQELNLPPKLVREIYEFSPLHDIGKVGVPDSILLKPGKLDPSEWELMKSHVTIGMNVVEQFMREASGLLTQSSLSTMYNIVAEHHEWWNGNGYPFGKRGEEISIEGRIVALADVFDALTTRRPYKEAFSFDESVKIITEESGTHFDPSVVSAFLKRLKDIRKIYEELKD